MMVSGLVKQIESCLRRTFLDRDPVGGGKGSPETLVQLSGMLLWLASFFGLWRPKSTLKLSTRRPKEHTTTPAMTASLLRPTSSGLRASSLE